jgi:hypothetical protein
MRLIAHRGLFNGPNKNTENKPEQILDALSQGFDCEVDLWVVNSEFWLGHDEPQYPIDKEFIQTYGLWIHAKNLDALYWLTDTSLWYFWHENDKFTLTSNKFIWTYPQQDLTARSIMLMPEWYNPSFSGIENSQCYAICSDYVNKIREIIIPTNFQNQL